MSALNDNIILNNMNINNTIINNYSNPINNEPKPKRKYTKKSKVSLDNNLKDIDIDNHNIINENNLNNNKKGKKTKENELIIPIFSQYAEFQRNKYSGDELRAICKYYNIKSIGNKHTLTLNIFNHLFLSFYALKIQKCWKRNSYKFYAKLRGPARFNRSLCVNETDFYSMDPLSDIEFSQFFSYKDVDNMIYGFDILSFYNLLTNTKLNNQNPYNRQPIPKKAISNFKSLINMSKLFGEKLNIEFEVDKNLTNPVKIVEMRAVSLFQEIDNLGNYSNVSWFLNLTKPQMIKFIRELYDIWNYRAHLSDIVKIEICPPYGNPFNYINLEFINSVSELPLKSIILNLIEQFIKNGIDQDSRVLGANYVLCALTLVSTEAALALPWLYESVGGSAP